MLNTDMQENTAHYNEILIVSMVNDIGRMMQIIAANPSAYKQYGLMILTAACQMTTVASDLMTETKH